MVRHRIRKTTMGQFDDSDMRAAVEKVLKGGVSRRQAATQYNLKRQTLDRYVNDILRNNKGVLDETVKLVPNYSVRRVFNAAQEKALVSYIQKRVEMCYGLSTSETCEIAYEMAVANKLKYPESWAKNKKAGPDWLNSFMSKHKLSLRIPEACSLSRMTAFNKHTVGIFYDNLEKLLSRNEKLRLPDRIWNLDETSTTTVQKPPKVLAKTGSRQINSVTSAERGILVTTCVIVNAAGNFMPPAMIFPRVNFKKDMIDGAPAQTLGLATPTGWINSDLFVKVMEHFIHHSGSTLNNPTILIFDNHESHLSPTVLDLAKANGVNLLTLPPHSSHKLQPLDICVFGPFKKFFNSSVQSWLLAHPGRTISIYQIAPCVGSAHMRAVTPSNVISGFKRAGIYPFDREIFGDSEFLSSYVTDRVNPSEINVSSPPSVSQTDSNESTNRAIDNQPSCSFTPETSPVSHINNYEKGVNSDPSFISPESIKGYPKAKDRQTNRKQREKGTSMIATDTPNKNKLTEKFKARNCSNLKKSSTKKALFDIETNETEDALTSTSSDVDKSNSDDNYNICDEFLKGKLPRPLVQNEFVLVEFVDKGRQKGKFYYIGQFTGKVAPDGAHEINFLRKNHKMTNTFCFPTTQDLADVPESDIKMILCALQKSGTTRRLQNRIIFDVSFECIDIR